MVWNKKEYPTAFKNLDALLRKKAIGVGNVLLTEGYPEEHAIPIAISQAEKWVENATTKEKEAFRREAYPKKTDEHDSKKVNQELLDNDVLVYYKKEHWYVQTKNAEKAVNSFSTKEEALRRAKEIAENKKSKVISYKKKETPESLKD